MNRRLVLARASALPFAAQAVVMHGADVFTASNAPLDSNARGTAQPKEPLIKSRLVKGTTSAVP